MANEPGISTSIVTDNSDFDRSMRRSESALDGIENKLRNVGKAGVDSGVRLSRATRAMNAQGMEAASLQTQLARLENEYLDVGNAASRTAQRVTQNARGFRMMRGQLYNASIQMQDFAVQVGAGTSAITAFSQNAPQFLSFFGPKAAAIGALIAALPLLKVGIDSIIGSFKNFDDTLEEAQSALDAYIKSMEALNSSFGGAYEGLMEQINATSVATADLARVHEQRAVAAVKAFAGALADSNTEVSLWRKLTGKTDIGLVGDLLEIETLLQGNITIFKENREEVRQFIEAVRGIDDAGSIDQMYEAALRAREIFVQNVDITGEMTTAQQQFLEQLALTIQMLEQMGAAQRTPQLAGYLQYYESLQRAAELTAKAEERQQQAYIQYYNSRVAGQEYLNNRLEEQNQKLIAAYTQYGKTRQAANAVVSAEEAAVEQARLLSGAVAQINFSPALAAAQALARQLNISLHAAMQMAGMLGAQKEKAVLDPRDPRYNEAAARMERIRETMATQGFNTVSPFDPSRAAVPASAGGGRGGGRGAPAVDPFESKLEQLRNSLMTEEELERQSYQKRTELLEEFLQRQPEKMAEYQELMERSQAEHQKRMAEIDVYRYGSGLQQTEAFLGDMAAALQGGNEKMLRIAKVFGAAEALVNSWRAYADMLASPSNFTLGQKLAAATAVLSAGFGAVQAIKGVSPGGSSSGGGAAAVGGAAAAPAIPTQTVSINLQGDTFSRSTVEGLLEQIQSQLDRGGRLVFQ